MLAPTTAVTFRFFGELNDFLPERRRDVDFGYDFNGAQTVKHLIEAAGVPHPEVEAILADSVPVAFDYQPRDGQHITVYPLVNDLAPGTYPPLRPPWPEPIAFLADNHLGRLARYLRLLGFDTAYDGDWDDDELAERSRDENRVLLTRDRGLLKRSLVQFGYCLRTTDSREQLMAVLSRFCLFDRLEPWRRCLRCNGRLHPVDKAAILDRLEPKTRLYYDDFQQCAACGQVYWHGSHMDELVALVEEVKQLGQL